MDDDCLPHLYDALMPAGVLANAFRWFAILYLSHYDYKVCVKFLHIM